MTKKIYIICGPTASGKTSLSIKIAKKIGGQIINADALQVYEDVPILTAAPSKEEMLSVPHHLFRYLDAFAVGNVNSWLNDVKNVIDRIDVPVFVGGTGLYLKALTEGLSPLPEIPEEIRFSVRQMSPVDIQEELQTPVSHTDPQRLMRALEVERATGKSILWWQQQPRIPVLENVEFKIISVLPPRDKLYLQCNNRFTKMLNDGALQELVELLRKNPHKTGGVFQALGAAILIEFLEGKLSFEEAIKKAQLETRHYAKRQMTWFRHQIKADLVLEEPILPEDI